jgi:hypothetical protein
LNEEENKAEVELSVDSINGDEDQTKKEPKTLKEKVVSGINKAKSLNAKFFMFESEDLDQYEPGQGKKNHMKTVKLVLKIAIGVFLFFKIIVSNFNKLGDEKSQSLTFKQHTNLTYPMNKRLLPVHQFAFFNKEDVKNRMECRVNKDKD